MIFSLMFVLLGNAAMLILNNWHNDLCAAAGRVVGGILIGFVIWELCSREKP